MEHCGWFLDEKIVGYRLGESLGDESLAKRGFYGEISGGELEGA